MSLAPIILFVYNRIEHTKRTLEALTKNTLFKKSQLFIYADGPKANADSQEMRKLENVRKFLTSYEVYENVHVIKRNQNFGLAKSIITGVTEVVNKYERVIVLEDDILTSPFFIQYMNEALDIYQSNDKVLSIGACNFFAHARKELPDTFFLRKPDCWGWATWKDKWSLFEPDAGKLYREIKENQLLPEFNLIKGRMFENMLLDQINEKVNSWAIRWHAVAFLHGLYTLYPKYSMTKLQHTGADSTHGDSSFYTRRVNVIDYPVKVEEQFVEENKVALAYIISILYPGIFDRIRNKLARQFP